MREVKIWAFLKHPNVLPLLGTVTGFGLVISMISPWMEEGDLTQYLRKNEGLLQRTDRVDIVSTRAIICYLNCYSYSTSAIV